VNTKTAAGRAVRALKEGARIKSTLARKNGEQLAKAARLIAKAMASGHKVLLFGNGGSAADAQHIACELVGRFMRERRGLPAIALTTDTSALTAISNDFGFDQVFARQVEALARKGDIVIALSTSGTSPNVLAGIEAARRRGTTVIGLTGVGGTAFARNCQIAFIVPSRVSPRIQEAHIAIGHILCELAEEHV
jgi:D-sedoheptulose 7-phosphate isomerase